MLQSLKTSPFISNILTLIGGNGASQLISLFSIFVLSRIYPASSFGVLATVVALTSILNMLAVLRFDFALMLPKDDKQVAALFLMALINSIVISIVLYLALLFWGSVILPKDLDSFTGPISFLVFSLFVLTLTASVFSQQIMNRKKLYSKISITVVVQSVLSLVFSLLLSTVSKSGESMVWGHLLGLICGTLYGLRYSSDILKIMFSEISFVDAKLTFFEYIDFPKKSLPGGFLNLLANQAPVLILQFFHSSSLVGQYSMTLRVLGAPMSLIGTAVSKVFFESIANEMDPKKNISLLNRVLIGLAAAIVVPTITLLLYAPSIFVSVFGAGWREAGEIARILIPYFGIKFVVSSVSTYIVALRRLNVEIFFNVLFLLTQIGSFVVPSLLGLEPSACFIYQSISGSMCFVGLCVVIYRLALSKASNLEFVTSS